MAVFTSRTGPIARPPDGSHHASPPGVPSARYLGWIAALALATVIPTYLISLIVGEREDRAGAVRTDMVRAKGLEQRMAGATVLPATDKDVAARYLTHPSSRPVLHHDLQATLALAGTFELPAGFGGGPDR